MTFAASARKNFAIAAFLSAMTCCNLTLLFRLAPSPRNDYQDFTIYYYSDQAGSAAGARIRSSRKNSQRRISPNQKKRSARSSR
jgi:hypothetical protein